MSALETMPETVNITARSIHSRAMLVSARISIWTARKYDKRVTAEVNAKHGATSDAGRFNKMLIPGDALSYKAIMQLAGSIRTQHYANTLAWSDDGWRLLPTANFATYSAFMRKAKADFDMLLADFITEYPALRKSAKIRLNGMYLESDYPAASQIYAKFGVYVDFTPLPAKGDFRVDLPADEVRRIEADCQAKVGNATNEAMADCWKRLYDCVTHIHERMATPDAIFRDSLIFNARELCDVLGRLNVTGDANLEAMRQEIESTIVANDPDTLRDNDNLRNDTATLAEDIIARMAGFYSPEV